MLHIWEQYDLKFVDFIIQKLNPSFDQIKSLIEASLEQNEDSLIFEHLVRLPLLSKEHVDWLIGVPEARIGLTKRKDLTSEQVKRLVRTGDPGVIGSLCEGYQLDEDDLRETWKKVGFILGLLAQENLPLEFFVERINTTSGVQPSAGINYWLEEERHKQELVTMAHNRKLPDKIRRLLWKEKSWKVKQAMLQNQPVPAEELGYYLNKTNSSKAAGILALIVNPHIGEEDIITMFTQAPTFLKRRIVNEVWHSGKELSDSTWVKIYHRAPPTVQKNIINTYCKNYSLLQKIYREGAYSLGDYRKVKYWLMKDPRIIDKLKAVHFTALTKKIPEATAARLMKGAVESVLAGEETSGIQRDVASKQIGIN